MNSEKQLLANQQNAQLSTGPKTTQGKAVIATNAIKHGIFTKDLIVSFTRGKETEEEYLEVLNNLIGCLTPQNQMESLLVEKIAVDFWRLRRVIRFETGSIGQYLEKIFKEFYSYGRKGNEQLDTELQRKKESIQWISSYIECLEKEEVSFDQPTWKGKEIESDILEDFCLIIRTVKSLTYEEKEKLLYEGSNFAKLRMILERNEYSSKKDISTKLIELYTQQIQQHKREIKELEEKWIENVEADKLNCLLGVIPKEENTDKILKYERSLQKSIFQNLFLLKKLQGSV